MLKLKTSSICDELIKASNCMNVVDAGKKRKCCCCPVSFTLSILDIFEFTDSLHCDQVNDGLVCAFFFLFWDKVNVDLVF